MVQKTWFELLGSPAPGARFEARGREIVETADGKSFRVVWGFEAPHQAAHTLAVWQEQVRTAKSGTRYRVEVSPHTGFTGVTYLMARIPGRDRVLVRETPLGWVYIDRGGGISHAPTFLEAVAGAFGLPASELEAV